ncbi:hypothetical protein E5E91_14135 [Deinococcus radiodurans R1 = ATCC 13939 = DSM 20539]|uniref:Uncharacterized protein n=1 Tax=Deinococcus radiodurans (strain ATCC 13939 / DSM 20539 / JCM 16871 / CCUG 27074 / LMG 4051 / NBRC 15346 / NCIMB 9279 / VKM B-1422 / R1) TaxID=243230 RepID=Q9RZ64_DEIRA|nr:hypothetical protein DR_A0090 [Deinococcus radiodurans R1 = ATCC 13939 = DSM 20539]QEM72908.1 hypothetical protein DXG80_13910 [Deinococcus radiodurans]UDL01869.1 hypothetical protein E5E91_14135 [Deinococcus radiodurans R1 = ATCC 13939 = DSM 20539]
MSAPKKGGCHSRPPCDDCLFRVQHTFDKVTQQADQLDSNLLLVGGVGDEELDSVNRVIDGINDVNGGFGLSKLRHVRLRGDARWPGVIGELGTYLQSAISRGDESGTSRFGTPPTGCIPFCVMSVFLAIPAQPAPARAARPDPDR